jgi:hypothetical protein
VCQRVCEQKTLKGSAKLRERNDGGGRGRCSLLKSELNFQLFKHNIVLASCPYNSQNAKQEVM